MVRRQDRNQLHETVPQQNEKGHREIIYFDDHTDKVKAFAFSDN